MKKSKIFARKVLAIVLSVMMASTAFTGALTAYATSLQDSHDSDLAANFMAWAETTDNQTAEALLDYADNLLGNAGIAPIIFEGNYVVVNIQIHGYIDSIDGVIDLIRQAQGLLDSYGNLLGGDVANVNLHPICDLPSRTSGDGIVSKANRSYRAENDAKTIVMALAKAIYWNSNDDTASGHTNKNVIGQFIKGDLSLGSILNGVLDVYGLIGDMLNMWSGYQSNLVYNLLGNIILENTNWFTETEKANYLKWFKGESGGTAWNFDTVLFEKLSNELINKISVNMTYAREKDVDENGETYYKATDSSESRYAKITKYLSQNGLAENDENIATASRALGYDPNLRYDYGEGWIYIFRYGDEQLDISNNSKFYDLVNQALKLAWRSVLQPTLGTLRVNNSMDWYKGHGGNFDNQYYYWLLGEGMIDENNWENNFTQAKFNAYAQANYANYGCADAEEFTALVRKTFDYDRSVVDDPTYSWRDVAESNNYVTEEGRTESILFGKLRYSPLADKVFNMQTGPINLYLMQTGFSNFDAFMDSYLEQVGTANPTYPTLVSALNDGLVAVVKDLFPDSANIGLGDGHNNVTTNLVRPTLATTGSTTNVKTIAQTLVSNTVKMFEYAANAADENILNPFYHNNGIQTKANNLSESNFEEAMIPLAVGCIKIIKDTESIHETDWDYAVDAEGVGFVALREYLSFSLPEKDYDQLVTTANGTFEATKDLNGDGKRELYADVLLPMARDAVGYLLNSIVPCRTKTGAIWNVYDSDPVTDTTTLFDILNSVICYYGSMESFTEPAFNTISRTTTGRGVAALLGAVNASTGACEVKLSNSIWQNISNVANALWPTIGVLQYGTASKAGQADAEELIYNKIVKSLLNISDVQSSTGEKGVTTIVMQLLTIFTAEPIMNKSIDVLVYDDVVASLVNSIFGARVSSQPYTKIIPTTSDMTATEARTPFDSLVQKKYIAQWKGAGTKENGVVGLLLANIYGAFGGDTETNSTQKANLGAGAWQGAMFAVQAVSYFVKGFIPELSDHKFKAASVSVNDPSRSNIAAGSTISKTVVSLKNEAVGLNRFYKAANGQITRDDRYFVEVVSLEQEASGARVNFTLDDVAGRMIAPERTLKVNLSGNNPTSTALVKFTFTYNVYLGDKTNNKKQQLYTNQVATCYLYLSTEGGWVGDTLTGADTDVNSIFPSEESDYTYVEYNTNGDFVNVYNNLVISNNNVAQVDDFGIEESSLDGLYAADDAGNAYVAFDADTGDVQNIDMYDYKIGNGAWQRGSYTTINGVRVYKGYTYDEVAAAIDGQSDVSTRTHIALSQDEDPSNAVIKTATVNADGKYTEVTVAKAAVTSGAATAATPTKGINFATIKDTEASAPKWLKYDGTTSIDADNYTMNLCGYIGSTTYNLGTTNVIIANTAGADKLQKAYENALAEMSPYQPADYTDYNSSSKSSDTNDELQEVFQDIVRKIAEPVSLSNADKLNSTEIQMPSTVQTKSATGDVAFAPATSVTGKLADSVYKRGNYYYMDADYTIPVYSNTRLTDAGVTNGMDAVGQAVVKQGDTYYLANDLSYEYDWDTTSYDYPYYAKTDVIAQYDEDVVDEETGDKETVTKNYYEQVQYQYFAANGMKVGSADDWAYKYAITYTAAKPNDGRHDYRGYYAQLEDALNYHVQDAKKHVDTSLITLITEDIIADRVNKDSVNYDVATYEKMVQIAKEGEALVSVVEEDEDGNKTYTTTASSVEIREANRLYNKYKACVIARGYEGAKLEAELAHLIGAAKSSLSAVAAVTEEQENEDGKMETVIVSNGSVSVPNGTTVKYGAVKNNTLVNEGAVVYSDETWNAYVNALADAIITAKAEEGENIAGTYNAKKAVVYAENQLAEPAAATTYVVSGTVAEAIDGTGTAGSLALANVTVMADGERLGKTDANGAFEVEVPLGVTEVTFKVVNGIDRTVTFSGTEDVAGANVGLIAIDYNADGKVNAIDAALMVKKGESKVNGAQFKAIKNGGVHYAATL